MRLFVAFSLISLAFLVAAEPPKVDPPKDTAPILRNSAASATIAPVILPEARAKFWRALAESQEATTRANKAVTALQAEEAQLRTACGNDHNLVMDKAGEPTCEPKPEAPPKK